MTPEQLDALEERLREYMRCSENRPGLGAYWPAADALSLLSHVRKLDARIAELEEQARRYYHADGTFEVLEPDEVIARRKAAAARIAELEARVGRLEAALCALRDWRDEMSQPEMALWQHIEALLAEAR